MYLSTTLPWIALLYPISIQAHPTLRQAESPDCQVVSDAAVGIELSTDYATSAISYPNGSTISIAVVQATEEYSGLMHRRASPSFEPLRIQGTTPYWPHEETTSAPAEQSKVLATSNLLKAIKLQSETTLGCPLPQTWIVYPDLPGLTQHEISAAARDAGIKAVDSTMTPSSAALVSGSWTRPRSHQIALGISWTRSRLLITMSQYHYWPTLFKSSDYSEEAHSSWELGSRSLDLASSAAEKEAFYARMYEEIRMWAANLLPSGKAITRIAMSGESVHKQGFFEILENLLGDILVDNGQAYADLEHEDQAPPLSVEAARVLLRRQMTRDGLEVDTPLYVAARGAAQMCATKHAAIGDSIVRGSGNLWRRLSW